MSTDIAVPQSPYATAVAQAIAAALAPMQGQIATYMSRAETAMQRICEQGAMNASGQPANATLQRVVPGAGGCGSCGGGCAGGKCSLVQGGGSGATLYGGGFETSNGGPPLIPATPGGPPLLVMPGCFQECDAIDPCLYSFYLEARPRFDEWSWLKLFEREIEVVHLDTNVGDGVLNQVPAQPLAANQSAILVQNGAQQLPWQPGLIKLNAKWTGTAAPELVQIQFYSGIAGITNVGDPTAAGLIEIGSAYKLSDFECGTDCYLVPWPKLFNCKTNAIPDTRRVYVRVTVGSVGAATLSSYAVTVLKRQTRTCTKYTNMYDNIVNGK